MDQMEGTCKFSCNSCLLFRDLLLMKLAILSGTSLTATSLFSSWPVHEIQTIYGKVHYREHGNIVLVNRHGSEGITPPHAINHRANIQALTTLQVDEVLAFSSVGSLKEERVPGSLISCSDYVSFFPQTFYDEHLSEVVPCVGNRLLPEIISRSAYPIDENGVYVQARGPRFETRAEIRIIRNFGDVVGMTFAHEADLCAEAGLSLTSLCMIDNYANGISDREMGPDRFRELVQENRTKVNHLFESILDMV